MNERAWRAERDGRSLRYAGRVLDPDKWILLRADPVYAERYDGQVAVLVAGNLLARMTPAVALDVPDVPMVSSLPWAGQDLRTFVLDQMYKADPYGKFTARPPRHHEYEIHLGRSGGPWAVHGSGWNAYIGPPPSPLPDDDSPNPAGPALAAILAAAEGFKADLAAAPGRILLNALTWEEKAIEAGRFALAPIPALGSIWTVGTGSVGTAILYFLALATRQFSGALFDLDIVKIHNLDRSPIFIGDHVGQPKVTAAEAWLQEAGVRDMQAESVALDESALWRERVVGIPDIVLAAANERNVRSVIENGLPPLQIYGTTGKNWQAAMIRHAPVADPCSCCVFPETAWAPAACATGEVARKDGGEQVDAALPFLSFAAGVMAAAEILKLTLPDYPFTANRVVLNTQPAVRAVQASLVRRPECLCQWRSSDAHRRMIAGSRYENHHSLRPDDHHRIKTTRPEAVKQDPKGAIQPGQLDSSWPPVALKNLQLMAKGDDLKL